MAKKLKLAIITNRFFPEVGGAEINIYYQAKKLAEKYDVTVICPKRIDKPSFEEFENIKIYRLYDLLNGKKYPNLKAKTLCPWLLWVLLKEHFDLIQCFPSINYNNMLAFLIAKIKRIPILLCSFDFLDYANIIEHKKTIDPDLLEHYQPKWKDRFILKHLDAIFSISEKEVNFFRKFNKNVYYSPVPILLEEFSKKIGSPRDRLGIASTDFVYLSLGRISLIKGQDIALKAFCLITKKIPTAKLVFVGRTDYEKDFFAGLQKIVKDHHLKDRVFFVGLQEREDVLAWLQHADISVIPVRFMNAGAVVVESWACETPIIMSDIVDPNHVVEDVNGYNFKAGDVEMLAEKMVKAYEHQQEFPLLVKNGLALVKEKFTYEYLISLYREVYEKCLQR